MYYRLRQNDLFLSVTALEARGCTQVSVACQCLLEASWVATVPTGLGCALRSLDLWLLVLRLQQKEGRVLRAILLPCKARHTEQL